jgi:hypothetical protein
LSSNTNIGNTPVNQGYVQLIHTGETGGIDGTLRTLYDGDGTASDLQIASNKVKISTELFIGSDTLQEYIQDTVGAMLVTNASHTNLSAAYDDAGDGAIDLTASGEVTLTGSQTLSNKTLTAPTLTGTTQGASITLSGDLTVNGTTTTVNQTNLDVSDNIIGLNRGAGSNANDSGLIIERGSTGNNAAIIWDESADKFTLGTTTSTPSATGDLTISTGTLVANVEGNVTGNVTGNADTATKIASITNSNIVQLTDTQTLTNKTLTSPIIDSVTISTIQTGSESFADNDTSLMTSAAVQDKIESFGYTTNTGDITGVDLSEGSGIDIASETNTTSGSYSATINLDLTEVGFGGGANRLITDDGDGTVSTEANLTFDGSTLALTGDLNVGSGDFFVDDSEGRVGIGTASPSKKLEVAGDVRIASGGDLIISDSGGGNDTFLYNDSQSLIGFINGAERFRVNSSGHLLIGGASASGHDFGLEVLNDHAYVKGPDGWNGTGDKAIVALGSAASNESFGCGYVYGTGLVLSTYKPSGGGDFGSSTQNSLEIADTTGVASFINDVVAFASSDKRLKENVKPLDNALDKINKINGIEFDWIDGKDKHGNSVHGNKGHDVGVIAQEIEEVLPEVVTTRDNGYKAVKYEKIVPLLIQAIKEQQKQIEELRNG